MSYKGKTVFITGGASGIGKECAKKYGHLGANVAIADWNEELNLQTEKELKAQNIKVKAYTLDVGNYDQVKTVMGSVFSDFGSLDIALNNAGIGGSEATRTAQHSLEDWDRVIRVNQTGVFYCMKEELKIMEEVGKGNIVNVSSIAGMRALPKQLSYVASKHAVIGMTKTAAVEYARTDIRINAVCPVFTNTPLVEGMFEHNENLRDKLVRTIPVGRYGEVSDISNAILWLTDPASSFVTGLCLPVDGGQTA